MYYADELVIPRNDWIMPETDNMINMLTDIMNARVPELLVSGPRNCGKSWSIIQCELALVEMNPGIQIINLRKYDSDFGGLLNQIDNYVLKYGLVDKRNPFTFHERTKVEPRKHIRFDNGAKIFFAGMDKKNKALGSAIDFAWYNEIQTEDNQEHWTAILGAMEGGRAGNWDNGDKYIAIADLNPTHKKFWAYLRANPIDPDEVAAMKHYYITHEDHPLFYSPNHKKWTNKGVETVSGLDRAYGVGTFDWLRNVKGEFCAAEGVVYPQFVENKNNIYREVKRGEIPDTADWVLSADFGKTASVGFYADCGDKHIRFKEIYRKEMPILEMPQKIKEYQNTYNIADIDYIITDHEHSGRTVLQDAGFSVKPANKRISIKDGIDLVRREMANAGMIFNKNSLDEPCPNLMGRINCLHDELMALVYPPEDKQTPSTADKPDKNCADHAADEMRYRVADYAGTIDISGFGAFDFS